MAKRSILIIIVIALALTVFSVVLSRRDSRDWRANMSRRLFPFPWQDTKSITIQKPDGTTLQFCKESGGEWSIILPGGTHDTMSNFAVDELAALATLPWREPLPDAQLPVPAKSIILTASSLAGQELELMLGEPTRTMRPAMIDRDDDIVYGVSQEYLRFLDWPVERFRKFTLANAGTGQRPSAIILSPQGADPAISIVLDHGLDGWKMRNPVVWPAAPARMEMLLRWVDHLRADRIEVEQTDSPEQYGFGPDNAFVEVIFPKPDGGKLRRRVEFGASAGERSVYARELSRSPVFVVSVAALSEIFINSARVHPSQWKNQFKQRLINTVGTPLPASLVFERLLPTPATLTIARSRDRSEIWTGRLQDGGEERTFAIDPPNPDDLSRPLSALLSTLEKIRIEDFCAETGPGPETNRWTALPAWRITVQDDDGRARHTLTLYATSADGSLPAKQGEGQAGRSDRQPGLVEPDQEVAFTIDGKDAVLTMAGTTAAILSRPFFEYQARKLLDSDPMVWSRVEIFANGDRIVYTRDPAETNEQWWRGEAGGKPLMDDNNVFVNLLVALSQLRSEGYVHGANGVPKKFGLDRPAITAIVYVSPKGHGEENAENKLFGLMVGGGAEPGTSLRYARLDNAGPVFLVPERLVEALVRDYE